MSRIFLGKPVHWGVLAVVVAVLWWLGDGLVQTRDYPRFLIVLAALTAAAVVAIVLTSRKGDRLTREPFEDDDTP